MREHAMICSNRRSWHGEAIFKEENQMNGKMLKKFCAALSVAALSVSLLWVGAAAEAQPCKSCAEGTFKGFTQTKEYQKVNESQCAPFFVCNNGHKQLRFNPDGTPTARTNKILAATPMGRFGDSEKDLVGALLFLLNNDAAGFITGICLPVDGGFSAYSGV